MIYQNDRTETGSSYMMQKIKHIFVAALVITLFFTAHFVQASAITSEDGNTSFKIAGSSPTLSVDQLILSGASLGDNDVYISYNSFSDFIVDQPLQVFNLPGSERPAADLIIIHANEVVLGSSIEIIGPKTDVLIIERDGSSIEEGTVYCNDCSFSNMNRITLSALKDGIGADFFSGMTEVGELTTIGSSKVIIDGLNAPAALALELVFSKVENNGLINLNQGLSDTGVGAYNGDINGDLICGTGSVNLFLGQYRWDYESTMVETVEGVTGSNLTLGGRIEAPNVAIFSTYPLTVDTNIDTRTDLLATTSHRGVLKIVDEAVTVATINMTAPLTLGGKIETEGSVDLGSVQDMSISSYSTIDASVARIVVANALYNFARISSDTTSIETGSIANEGKILSKSQVSIDAVDYIFNQYGGVIQSKEIILDSESGIVRNGSKTPYKDTSLSANTLLSYSDNFIDNLDSTQLGAFYQSNVNTSSDSLVLAPNTTASILGNKVEIFGAAFENINPYYVFVEEGLNIEIDYEKAQQIRLITDEKLTINVANYILNSSAMIYMNNAEGELRLTAPLVNNERYRVQASLDFSTGDSISWVGNLFSGVFIDTVNTRSIVDTEAVVYSVPGIISSFGDVHVEASQSFVNNTAYIEVFGDLYVESPTVSSLGYDLTGLEFYIERTRAQYDQIYGEGATSEVAQQPGNQLFSGLVGLGSNLSDLSGLTSLTSLINSGDIDAQFAYDVAFDIDSNSFDWSGLLSILSPEQLAVFPPDFVEFWLEDPEEGGDGQLLGVSSSDILEKGSSYSEHLESTQLDTLFFVDGTIYASEATGWFRNNLPVHGFAKKAIEQDLVEEYEGRCFIPIVNDENDGEGNGEYYLDESIECDETVADNEQNNYYLNNSYSIEVNEGSNELLVHRAYDYFDVDSDNGEVEVRTGTTTQSYDLFDLVEQSYSSAVDWLAELYEEIRFW